MVTSRLRKTTQPTLPTRHAIFVEAENYQRLGFVLYRHTLAPEVFCFFHKVSDDTLLFSPVKVAQNSFQHLNFDGSYDNHSLLDATIMVSKYYLFIGKYVVIIFVTQ